MRRIYLFFASCLLAGIGGAVGSIIGNGLGGMGRWIGGILGGLLGATSAAVLSRALGWIMPIQVRATATGAALGFLIAAPIAVNTLSSPIGPIFSTVLVGVGQSDPDRETWIASCSSGNNVIWRLFRGSGDRAQVIRSIGSHLRLEVCCGSRNSNGVLPCYRRNELDGRGYFGLAPIII